MIKTCPECGREFTPIRSSRIYCYDEQCYTTRHRKQSKDRYIPKKVDNRIRPYTPTSNMMLVDDIRKGWSVQRMAKVYDRDVNDLRRHIRKIISGSMRKGETP